MSPLKKGTQLFRRRDSLAAELRKLDAELEEQRATYAREARIWGLTMTMFRQQCQEREASAASSRASSS